MSLLGLVGLRGAIVAVHDLGALLGVTTDRSAPWLLVARQAPIALAFQGLERHLKVRTDALLSSPDQRVRGAEAAFDDGTRRTVIEIDHVVAQLLATPSVHERDKTHGE
jgi:purine-binding chemotaxis protein CheW